MAASTLRPEIHASRHAVSAGHYLASAAALAVLEAGGNAIDAGVCGGIALGVLQSDLVGVAGVAPIMVWLEAEQRVVTVSGLGWWPKAASSAWFREHHGGKQPKGVMSMVVPAAPDAWITALELWGTMSFGQCAEAAIRFAREGFAMNTLLHQTIANNVETYRSFPASAAIYLRDGEAPAVGARFVQEDLGRTLQHMADEERGAAAKGGRAAGLKAARDAFYKGDIARTMVDFVQAQGGWMTMDDMAGFRVGIEPACSTRFGDTEVFTCGPWCQGPALLEIVNIVERFDLSTLDHNSPRYLHLLTEATKLAMADREAWIGDPRHFDVPIQALTSKDFAARRATRFEWDKAWPGRPPAASGKDLGVDGDAPRLKQPPPALPDEVETLSSLDTSYLCVVDRHGNVFSATPSDGSYHGPVVPGLGFVPSCRGVQNWAEAGHASEIGPYRRPRLTPNPAMAIRGRQFIPFGTPGGDVQTQAMLQTLLNLVVWEKGAQEAVEAPRFASYSFPSSFEPHAEHPGLLRLEGRVERATGDALAGLGHKVEWWPDMTWLAGSMGLIVDDRDTGFKTAAADPRRMAFAVGV
ncbi:MAG: gamma-glutamyltransferase [Alphaproteobacteria bacterium]|nr:gamma-glutamyltransferase [Alphaproteobacteria bacterium]MCB9931311.1 gamma-glutamyltransferase [Alphaproteobacteria bacterium]